jgi:beta-mannosidase
MKQRIGLNEDWSLTWSAFGGELGAWIAATVPGDVHQDMIRAGALPNPYYGLNGDVHRALENWDWFYRRDFIAPRLTPGQRVLLVFEGIDTVANVYLNGLEIARSANMWTPVRVDVTSAMKPDQANKIIVRIAPATDPNVQNSGIRPILPRKAQFNFGWDIAPRLVSAGIWRPVYLEIVDTAEISDLRFRIKHCGEQSADLAAEVEIEAPDPAFGGVLQLEVFAPDGAKVAGAVKPARPGRAKIAFKIRPAQLWWPNMNGPQPLYTGRVTLAAGGHILDRRELKFGIRTVELVAGDEKAETGGFFFRVNGKRLFMKGFNWTPADAMPGTITAERYRTLLQRVRDCGANMLRVWGGGLYEPDLFYELCSEYGILIWQDFMFACAKYPSDAKFLREIKREGEAVVRRLRKHTCLALWCGGNENDAMHGGGSHAPGWKVLDKVCCRLDPDTPYIQDSPWLARGVGYVMPSHGRDAHNYWHRDAWQVPLTDTSDFLSECGKIAVPDLETLRSCIPEDKLWPPHNEYWYYHVTDTERIGFKYRVQCLLDAITGSGMPEPQNIEEFIARSQECQAKFLKRMVEHYAGLPNCGGILLWNVCDCWPQVSDALIAWNLKPKPAYQAVKEVYLRIAAKEEPNRAP